MFIKSESIKRNKNRIWGSFKLSDGSKTNFEMRKGESWFPGEILPIIYA